MPNLTLTSLEASRFLPLPGHALLQTSPAEIMTPGGLYKPETAAEVERQREACRKGKVIRINGERNGKEHMDGWSKPDLEYLMEGREVYYLGHFDEADNAYVVVKIGQIVAVEA